MALLGFGPLIASLVDPKIVTSKRRTRQTAHCTKQPPILPVCRDVLASVKPVFGTELGTPFIFPGTGTGGWEAALTNTLSPGDRVVAFRYGLFSHLWIEMMQRLGLNVTVIDSRWGDGADEAKLEEVLRADTEKTIRAVAVVHNETATGVTSDIAGVRRSIDQADHPALLLVDGVSSIAALPFELDAWGVDVAVTGSQKALSLPTGLALVVASEKALDSRKTAKLGRVYYDFEDMLKTNPAGAVPYTPVLPLLHGLKASLHLLQSEGLANVFARHRRLAEGARAAVHAWGLPLLCRDTRWQSDTLTVVEAPPGVDSQQIVDVAYAKYNLSLGLGLAEVKGKVFRIGHLGNMDEIMLAGALSGVEMTLRDVGYDVQLGSGVGAALEIWQREKQVIPTREHLVE